MKIDELMGLARAVGIDVPGPETFEGFRYRSCLAHFAAVIAAAEREACARHIERCRLQIDGSHGVTPETDHIATRITDFMAASLRAMRQI